MCSFLLFFFFNDPATTEIYTLSLHDALPISCRESVESGCIGFSCSTDVCPDMPTDNVPRSEEHTSELQSRPHLVCRLLLEKKKSMQSRMFQPANSPATTARIFSAKSVCPAPD